MQDGAVSPGPLRPELTLPAQEAATLRAHLARAGTVLEYGSGGSTLLAAEAPGRQVFSVESDPDWHAMMEGWFAAHPPAGRVVLHHADIGPTKAWGRPVDERRWRRWPGYALSVWDRPDFVAPDLVLIDGRFRLACLLTVAFRTARPVTVLFDDYVGRAGYRRAESFVPLAGLHGRMARFEVTPTTVPAARLGEILEIFARTQ